MTVTITQAHNEDRLAGTLTNLDRGSGNAKMRIYDGTRPGTASAPATGNLLSEITLTKPAGTIANGQLVLTQLQDGLNVFSGTASWVRFITADGLTSFDCDVDTGSNNGEVQLATRQLYAGGGAKMLSTILG